MKALGKCSICATIIFDLMEDPQSGSHYLQSITYQKIQKYDKELGNGFLLHTKLLAKICNKIYVKQTILSLYTEVCCLPAYSKGLGSSRALCEFSLRGEGRKS